MKKETINVFDGGLNKDLNPVVTPNNILTDNLNGTFLTYNGDELSLQNDSGNTRIPVEGTGDSVKLSDGFYPLGMKEYGGVLYIVSGKKGVDENGLLNSKYDEIEFGSYPSPELASYTTIQDGTIFPVTLLNNNDTLYKAFTINTNYFKTGRYIKFIPNVVPIPNMSNVWTRWNFQGIYNIKLLLKLDNGTIDLTDDVWNKYEEYKDNNPEDLNLHWLLSPNFIYHCPYSYKGKLLIQTVLSEPVFSPIKYYDVESTDTSYNFQLDIKIENTEALEIVGYNIEILADKESIPIKVYNPPNPPITPEGILHISENISLENKLMHYTITPIFKHISSMQILDWNSLPFEFQDKYKIKSYVLLEEKYNNIGFSIEESGCISSTGEKEIRVLSLIGESGYINTSLNNLGISEKPYVFIRDIYTPSNSYTNILGKFTIDDNGFPVVTEDNLGPVTFQDNTIKELVLRKLRQTPVKIKDSSCAEGTITLVLSAPLETTSSSSIKDGKLSLYQPSSPTLLEYSSWDGKSFTVRVNLTEPLSINLQTSSFDFVQHTILAADLIPNHEYKIGLSTGFYSFDYTRITGGEDRSTNIYHILKFYSKSFPQNLFELCDHINDQFGTNIENRLAIVKQNAGDNFVISENRMYFSKNNNSGTFIINITDDDYEKSLIRHYFYKFLNATKVLPDEYINISSIDQNTNYIKIGTSQLGYILFKETDLLHTLTNLINVPLYSNLT